MPLNRRPSKKVRANAISLGVIFGYSLDAIFDAGIKEQREAEARGEKLQFARLPIARPFFT